jgi:hypothetical protein
MVPRRVPILGRGLQRAQKLHERPVHARNYVFIMKAGQVDKFVEAYAKASDDGPRSKAELSLVTGSWTQRSLASQLFAFGHVLCTYLAIYRMTVISTWISSPRLQLESFFPRPIITIQLWRMEGTLTKALQPSSFFIVRNITHQRK